MGKKNSRKKKVPTQQNKPVKKIARIKNITQKTQAIDIVGWKLWLFRIIAITVFPVFVLLILETGLRIYGYGYPTSLTIRCKANNVDSYCSNMKFSWRYFPPEIARTMDPFSFPVNKPEDTYRIFVIGASAAAGVPDGAYSFGRMLEVMLNQKYPETNFDIIIAAMPAINSHVVLEIAKDSARYKPDMFIMYLGNNEVVGPYGAGTVFSPFSANLSLIRFGVAMKVTKVGQLVTSLTNSLRRDKPKAWLGMEMFLDKQVRKGDPQMKIVYRNFRQNLEDIFYVAEKIKTPLICCTVGSNLKDNPPFASQHRRDLKDSEKEQWEQIYQQGINFENNGDYSSAAETYLKAAQIDSDYADLQFRLGRCYWQMNNFEESKERYILARELDTLRFRADTQINNIIREVAQNKTKDEIFLVDACKVIEENSPNETPGKEMFYEHVHLNFKGNYLLAKTIFQQVDEILPEHIKQNIQERSFPSEQEIARFLAYTDYEKYSITIRVVNEFLKQPPFSNQLYNKERVREEEFKVNALKAALTQDALEEIERQYVWAIQQNPSDAWLYCKYGLMLDKQQNPVAALRQFEIVFKYEPTHFMACSKIALCYGLMQNLDMAIEYNIKALKIHPKSADAYFNLGYVYQLKNMYNKAIKYYKIAISIDPLHVKSYNNLGLLLYKEKNTTEAINIYRTGIKFVPDYLNLHYNLGILLKDMGKRDEAKEELLKALKIDPNSTKVRTMLNSI